MDAKKSVVETRGLDQCVPHGRIMLDGGGLRSSRTSGSGVIAV